MQRIKPGRPVDRTRPEYFDKIAAGKSNGPTSNSGASLYFLFKYRESVDASNIQCPWLCIKLQPCTFTS